MKMFSLDFWSGNKPVLYIFFLYFLCFQLNAQENLVPNGSFEEYNNCPMGISDFSVKNWVVPTWGTSDYFNSCNDNQVDIPENFIGNQVAHNGSAFCGFGACFEEPNKEEREYIQIELIEPLLPNKIYSFSCFVSLAENVKYCSNDIGVAISDHPIGGDYTHTIYNSEPYYCSNFKFYCDTVEWNEMNIYFAAEGGEKYLTIGQFKNDVEASIRISNSFMIGCSYYYIDDVNLSEYIFPEFPNVFTPNNDGANDTWTITEVNGFELTILNRWGDVILKSTINEKNFSWDGKTINGINCVDGVYFYSIGIKNIYKTGFIYLMR